MEPKEAVRPRVLIEYVVDKGYDQQRMHYCAGFVDGISGSDIMVILPIGVHCFSRKDGTWLSGDCLNYADAKILNFEKVEAAVKAGYHGDIEMHAKNTPMCEAAAS